MIITRNELTKHFEEAFKNYFIESEMPKLTIAITDEFSYNTLADIDIKIKYLTGSIINNKISLPIQFIIEIDNKHFNEVIEVLNNFATEFNENIYAYSENVNIKELYATPVVINAFEDNGLNETTIVGIDARLVIYEGGVFISDTSVKIDDLELVNITNIMYSSSKSADALITKETPIAKNMTNAIQIVLSFDIDFKKGDELHKLILEDSERIAVHTITFNNGFIEKEYIMEIASCDYNILRGDVMSGRISLRTTMEAGA